MGQKWYQSIAYCMICPWAAWGLFKTRPLKFEKNVFSVLMTFDVAYLGNVASATK
jgi:hypothetical protein